MGYRYYSYLFSACPLMTKAKNGKIFSVFDWHDILPCSQICKIFSIGQIVVIIDLYMIIFKKSNLDRSRVRCPKKLQNLPQYIVYFAIPIEFIPKILIVWFGTKKKKKKKKKWISKLFTVFRITLFLETKFKPGNSQILIKHMLVFFVSGVPLISGVVRNHDKI